MTVYHQNSPYGKAQTNIDSNECVCGVSKVRNQPFCSDCFSEVYEKDEEVGKGLKYGRGEERLERYIEGLELLGRGYKERFNQ